MPISQVAVRQFTWSDLSALAALQSAGVGALERWLRQPNLVPERDCLIAEAGGVPAGYGYLVVEAALGRGVLIAEALDTADRDTVERAVLDAAMAHARSLGLSVLQEDVPELHDARRAMLASAGMAPVRTHLHLRRAASDKIALAPGPDATLRLAGPGDAAALTELQNAAFAGSWGYCDNTVEEIRYSVFELERPPDDVVLLEVSNELVGYCRTHRELGGRPGVIGMVGVLPERQGRGLGRVVTAAGLDHLVDQGALPVDITVDAENAPAFRVYERLGFELQSRSLWYELHLAAG